MKRFYVMDLGEDFVIRLDTEEEVQIPVSINQAVDLLNEQQEELALLKKHIYEMSMAVIVKANPVLSSINEFMKGLSEENRVSLCSSLLSANVSDGLSFDTIVLDEMSEFIKESSVYKSAMASAGQQDVWAIGDFKCSIKANQSD